MEPRFLLDGMLGGLARWLRICGYDANYIKNATDEELIEKTSEEGLTLLTRDKLLCRKAFRAGLTAFLVEGGDDPKRLASVSKRFSLTLEPECSRCPECGEPLRTTDKEALKDRIPARTFEAYDRFWVCESCGKVYWRGSHWKNILDTIKEANRIAGSQPHGSEHDL